MYFYFYFLLYAFLISSALTVVLDVLEFTLSTLHVINYYIFSKKEKKKKRKREKEKKREREKERKREREKERKREREKERKREREKERKRDNEIGKTGTI